MGKFNTTTQGGQISELDKLSTVDLPTGIQEETVESSPPAGTSVLDSLPDADVLDAVREGTEAGIEQEQVVQEQQEREFVPDIITRRDDPNRVDFYDRKSPAKEVSEQALSEDGGLSARSKNMANKVANKEVTVQGLGIRGDNIIKESFTAAQVLDETGNLDKGFLQMASVITENTFADLAFNEGIDQKTGTDTTLLTDAEQIAKKEPQETAAVSKANANERLGRQINQEWHKYKNRVEGNPQGPVPELSKEQALALGDVAKELYYETNKGPEGARFMNRYTTDDGQTAFSFTKHGADLLKKGNHKRKRMFPKQHVRPSITPTPGGQLVGEGRVYTKRVSSKIKKPIAGKDVINQAINNLNKVPNVVDKQRLKILLASALPVLTGQMKPDSLFATMNNVGTDVYDKFAAKAATDPDFNAEQNYESLIDDLAQSIYGIARERKQANFLTYYMQGFTGRIAPQQTHFDPTSSKAVRFVTRNAVPAIAVPGGKIERNLRQMYAMMLVKGADTKLPAEREIALERATPQLTKWGLRLKQALNSISDAQVDAAADAITQGIPVTDPKFPKLPVPDLNPQTDAELIQAIKDKGEDGPAFVDGLIDFANYYENKINKKPHKSYFNAYMDGKTNGLASNGIQMGSESIAYKTGVLRSQRQTLLDGDIDLRDDLRNTLLADIDQEGFDGDLSGFANQLPLIATKLYANRDMNKQTTMTFGYGRELASFKPVLEKYLNIQQQSDPELKEAVDSVDPKNREKLIDALHTKYVGGLVKVLDANALKSRSIMKGAAILHALTNELFTIRSPIGLELNFGGTETTGYQSHKEYTLNVDGRRSTRNVVNYGEEHTAAAAKRYADEEGNITLDPGGIATGGAVVGPVQSLDAATVALTASGKSWHRLNGASQGNPYLHTIYDAFKVDAMGYDVVLDEVNKNWLEAGMNWSYLEETQHAIDSLRETWANKNKGKHPSTALQPNEWAMAKHLLTPGQDSKGKVAPMNLRKAVGKIIDVDPNMKSEDFFPLRAKIADKIIAEMKKAGYDYNNPPVPTLNHLNTLIKSMSGVMNLNSRLSGMIKTTNENKSKLRSKIKSDGAKVYQYYSH